MLKALRTFFALAMVFGCWTTLNQGTVSAATLIMFEQGYCEWCDQWHEDIGVVYHKTTEGKRAALRRVDIHSAIPDDIAHIKIERFTPTFVLIDDGQEVGRIRGYPGEDFFWGLLGQIMKKLPPIQYSN